MFSFEVVGHELVHALSLLVNFDAVCGRQLWHLHVLPAQLVQSAEGLRLRTMNAVEIADTALGLVFAVKLRDRYLFALDSAHALVFELFHVEKGLLFLENVHFVGLVAALVWINSHPLFI